MSPERIVMAASAAEAHRAMEDGLAAGKMVVAVS